MPVVEKTDNSNESPNRLRQQDEEDSPSDIEDKKEKTKQMKAIIKRRELISLIEQYNFSIFSS